MNGSFNPRNALSISLLAGLIALLATILVAREESEAAHERAHDVIAFEADHVVLELQHSSERVEAMLRTASALFTKTQDVALTEWRPMLQGLIESDEA